jgi:hypothetical protein
MIAAGEVRSLQGPRRLIVVIVLATLATVVAVAADLARGGRPDPPALRAAATLLDGSWRFHTGDDPHWADAATDDTGWETIDLTAQPGSHDDDVGLPDYVGGWMAHGHPGYYGYAWYRRAVEVPAVSAEWDILGPTLVEDGYELYWNGQLLGGSGRLGPDPRLVGTRPLRFALPADAAGRRGVLAIRAYTHPRAAASADGGGLHTPPMLAPRPVSDALHRAQWERTIAGYVVDAVEPIAMVAVIGLAVWCGRRGGQKGFLVWASVGLVFMAARRSANAIVSWTDLMDLTAYAWQASVLWVPAVAAWTWAWNRWCLPPSRSIDVSAAVLAAAGILGAEIPSGSLTRASRIGSLALLIVIAARVVRGGRHRSLALVTLASIMAALFGSELLDPIGVPGIWFPFGIGVSRTQYIYAVVIPLVAVTIVRSLVPATSPASPPSR